MAGTPQIIDLRKGQALSKKLFSLFSLLLVFTLLAAACGGGETDTDTDTGSASGTEAADGGSEAPAGDAPESVKIAYQGPLTGDNAALGQNMICGVELAVQELNETGEVPTIEILRLDSQGDPAQAPALTNQAV